MTISIFKALSSGYFDDIEKCCNCAYFEKEECPEEERFWLFVDNHKHSCHLFKPADSSYVYVSCD